jgi:hypothetical protein
MPKRYIKRITVRLEATTTDRMNAVLREGEELSNLIREGVELAIERRAAEKSTP